MPAVCIALGLAALSPVFGAPPKLPEPPKLEFKPPRGERFTLNNGMTVFLLEDRDIPLVRASAVIRTGTYYDVPGKAGTAVLTGKTMRSGGSRGYDADAMNETLEFLGADVETGMGDEGGWASLACLSKHRDAVLPLFADVMKNPAFREDKLKVEKDQLLESIRRRNDDPRDISRREARRALFGPDHPYGLRYESAEVAAITRADLLTFHQRYFRPRAVTLAVSGDFEKGEMLAALEKAFGDWRDAPPAPLPAILPVKAGARRVVLITKDNITQTAFRIVSTGLKRHEPDHFDFEVANDILGGNAFISRLFTDVRSRKGLAYGVGSFFAEWQDGGMIGAVCGTRNENAAPALKEVLGHIRAIRESPVTDAELETAKNSIINSFIFNYQTSAQIIGQRASLEFYGFPPDYLDTYLDRVRGVDKARVQAAAKKWLAPDDSLILLVGPGALEKEAGAYGPVEVRRPD